MILISLSVDGTKIHPSVHHKEIGEDAEFKCDYYGHLHILTIWKFNEGRLPANAKAGLPKRDKLIIRAITVENKGLYECIGTLNQTNYPAFAAIGHLIVSG